MSKDLLEKLIQSVGVYYSLTSTDGISYSNIPADFNKNEMLVKYKDRYYDRKIGFVDISKVRYELTIFNDVTEIKKQSMFDQKTGALTLEYFKKKTIEDIETGKNIILCLIDIDDFKLINDTFGHHVGDLALSEVVDALKKVIGPNDSVCRFGGDEFLVALESDDVASVRNLMNDFATGIRNSLFLDDNICIDITFSIGVAKYNKDNDFDANFNYVDSAMYFCKKNGKDGVVSKEVYAKVIEKKYSN